MADTTPQGRFQWCCANGCGPCKPKLIAFEYLRTETLDGEHVSSEYEPRTVSECCGADLMVWDEQKKDFVDAAAPQVMLNGLTEEETNATASVLGLTQRASSAEGAVSSPEARDA